MRTLFSLLCIAMLAGSAGADSFWVDGVAGADLPGRGRSAAAPWKTISYALGQMPAPGPGARHTLFVAGGQTYAAATNGEAFPLRPRFDVAIVGAGARPVLSLTPSDRGVVLDPARTYARTRLANLHFQGGIYGLELGGAGSDHAPEVVDCAFEGSTYGVLIAPVHDSVTAPCLVRCAFSFGEAGVFARVWGSMTTGVTVALLVQECAFADPDTAGVLVDHGHDGPTDTSVDVRLESCRFERGVRGVFVVTEALGATNRNRMTVLHSAFRDHAIGIEAQGRIDELTVERCSFVEGARAGSGVMVLNSGLGAVCTLRGNFVSGDPNGSTGFGFSAIWQIGFSLPRVVLEDNLVTGCNTGCALGGSGRAYEVDARRNRFVGNRYGLRVSGPGSAGSAVRLDSSLFAAQTDTGLRLDTDVDVQGRGLTIADNARVGLDVVAAGPGTSFEHCVLSDNGTEVAGAVAIRWSALKGQSHPGTGNLQVEPRLDRPTYKLQLGSPCIDAGTLLLALPATDHEGDPRVVGPLPDLGADEYVPGGSARPYGVAGFGALAFCPRIESPATGVRLGHEVPIHLRGALDAAGTAAAWAALLLGTGDVAVADLHPLGAPGSFLWNEVLAALPAVAVDPQGNATQHITLPVNTLLLGRVFTCQWLAAKPGANQAGLVTTEGLRATVGL